MNKIEYTKMFELEDVHFWFVAKRFFMSAYLDSYKKNIRKILDLGSGTGGATGYLKKYGEVEGIENYEYAITLAKKRGLKIKKGDINNLRLPKNHYNLITILDVLYHKDVLSEKDILKKVHSALKKGGYVLITDSALNILTGKHDEATKGKKRYTLKEIKQIVVSQGFQIVRSSYVYFSIFPVVLIKRLLLDKITRQSSSDVSPVSPVINSFLLYILKIEAWALRYVSFPIGSSVILLAKKK